MGERHGPDEGGALLFGRRTYEDFYGVWPKQTDNPFTDGAQPRAEVRRLDAR